MIKKSRDPLKDKKEQAAYLLFFSFVSLAAIKTVFGVLAGSKCLLVAGIFALFGVFISVVSLIRISRSHPLRGGKVYFNPDKLEFIFVLGISIIITVSTAALLFSIGHMVFFHTLYPPQMMAAWAAIASAAFSLGLMVWMKKQRSSDMPELDGREISFILTMDFLLSILAIVTVVISRAGSTIMDYGCAILTAFSLIVYGISFLSRAFKGLMDASCDRETFAEIEGLIGKALPDVDVKMLRVNRSGHLLEIMMTLTAAGDETMKDAASMARKVRDVFEKNLLKPHEVLVGIAERS